MMDLSSFAWRAIPAFLPLCVIALGAIPAPSAHRRAEAPSHAVMQSPADPSVSVVGEARRLRGEGRLQEAASLLRAHLSTNPAANDRVRFLLSAELVAVLREQGAGAADEAEALAHTLVKQYPSRFEGHVLLAQILKDNGRHREAAEVLLRARTAVPDLPAIHVLEIAQFLLQHVEVYPNLELADVTKLLDRAEAVTQELIASRREVRLAMMVKSMALKLRAERVEGEGERRRALTAESERIWEEARGMNADGTPVPRTLDREWSTAEERAFALREAGRTDEEAAVYESFVESHADFAPAHLALAMCRDEAAEKLGAATGSMGERSRLFQLAETHYRRAADLAVDEITAIRALDALIALYGSDKLNRPSEGESLLRSALQKYPTSGIFVFRFLESLFASRPKGGGESLVRQALTELPSTPEARFVLGSVLYQRTRADTTLTPAEARAFAREAVAALDTALAARPEYIEAILYKSFLIRLQAERFETDPARAKALAAEADRLQSLAERLRARN